MSRYADVVVTTGLVDNVIVLEPGAAWPVPPGHELVASDTASPGDTYRGGRFVPPRPTPPSPQREATVRAVAAIEANRRTAPWGPLLEDLAVSQGLIEP